MLLPYMSVADVITTEADVIACYILFYFIIGWCYCQYVADVIATFGVMWWQMLLQVADVMATVGWVMVGGWCYYHQADGVAMGQWFVLI